MRVGQVFWGGTNFHRRNVVNSATFAHVASSLREIMNVFLARGFIHLHSGLKRNHFDHQHSGAFAKTIAALKVYSVYNDSWKFLISTFRSIKHSNFGIFTTFNLLKTMRALSEVINDISNLSSGALLKTFHYSLKIDF